MDTLVRAMATPSFYPHGPDAVELRETPISWVFLAGERAYKVKKPVVLPFLDYGSLERRRWLCEEEVRLNRRLAPDVYLGARPIVRTDGGLALGEGDARSAVEWAVEMRRLPEDRTLDRLLRSGELDADGVRAVAGRLAEFHARAERSSPDCGAPAAVRRPIEENFDTLLDLAGSLVDRRALAAAGRFVSAFLTARRNTFVERARAGRIRDCHGDLRMEHVVLEGERVQIFDCLEFDPALREIDVAADLAVRDDRGGRAARGHDRPAACARGATYPKRGDAARRLVVTMLDTLGHIAKWVAWETRVYREDPDRPPARIVLVSTGHVGEREDPEGSRRAA